MASISSAHLQTTAEDGRIDGKESRSVVCSTKHAAVYM
jgi:hypothetical protein